MGNDELDDKLQGAFRDRFDEESTAPPEVVWKHVHAAIVAEKKKRRFLFWLIPAILFLGGGIATALFFAFQQPANHAPAVAQTFPTSTASTSTTSKTTTIPTLSTATPSADAPTSAAQKTGSSLQTARTEQLPAAVTTTTPPKRRTASSFKTAPTARTQRHGKIPAKRPARSSGILPIPHDSSPAGASPVADNEAIPADTDTPVIPVEPPVNRSTPPRSPQTDKALSLLAAKSVLPWLTPSIVTPMKPFLPPPFPRWSFGMEIGLGKNNRNISGTYTESYKSPDLVSNDVKMANRCFGFSVGHRFNPYISLQTGITTGIDSYTSRWFLRLLTNQGTDGSYNFRTSEGNVRMASADVKDYFQNSDTAVVRMRLHHRSRYFSIPLSMKFTLPGQKISPYFRLGASYDFYTNNRTTVLVNSGNGNISRTVNLSRAERGELHSTQLLLGIGFETHRNAAWQFFLEPQLSVPLSPIYGTTNFHVTSQYVQLRAGMTFYF